MHRYQNTECELAAETEMDDAIDQERLAVVVKLLTQSLKILDVTEQTQAALHVSLALEALGLLTNSND